MRELQVRRSEWEPTERRQHAAPQSGLDEPVRLVDADTGRTIAVQAVIPDEYQDLKRELARWLRFRVKYDDSATPQRGKATGQARLSGIRYESRTFGFVSAQPLRRRYAATDSTFSKDEPEVTAMLAQFAQLQDGMFHTLLPDEWQAHCLLADQIHDDWKFGGTPWTSGIINNTAALPYHRDKGNVRGTWSTMLGIRDNMEGGALHLPEYGVTFGIPDGSVTMFDGQGTWHGVTPMVRRRANAHRFTIVLYAKQGFVGKGSREDEERAAKVRATKVKGEDHETVAAPAP